MAKSGFFNPDATPQEPSTKSSFYPGGAQDVEQVDGSFYETDDAYVEVTTAAAVGDLVGEAQAAADAAAASETAAASSETNAATSASAAAASQSAAATSASAAAASQSAAAASASAAAGSASSAATSATNASNSASAAANSETNAAASASAAAGSASASASSASDAAQSAIDAAAAVSSVATFDPELSVIYVSKIGSDADAGTQRPSPKLTLASAITAAAALVSGGAPKAVVRVLDAGVYTENISLAANVVLDAKDATLVGTLTLDAGSSAFLHRHYSNGSGQHVVEAITTSGETSFYQADILDGRGLAGTDINNQCIRNGTAGRVIMATVGQVFVPQGGEGVRDGTAGGGFGHVHFFIRDLYLAGNNAKGLTTNNATTWIVGYIEHILKVGTPTGTVGINLNDAGSTISLTSVEVNADTAYNIVAGSLYLNCPKVSGTQTGSPVVDTSYFSNGTRGDITVSGGGATWTIGNTKVTYAKIQNVSITDRLLGRDTTGVGSVEEIAVGGGIEFTGTQSIQVGAFSGDVTKTAGGTTLTIGATVVTYAKIQNVSAQYRILGRTSAGAGPIEEISTLPAQVMPAHTGDVTSSAGSVGLTIANDAVTYAKMQNVSATDKLLGRSTAGSGDVEEISCTAAGRALIDDATAAAQRVTLGTASLPGARTLSGSNNTSFLTTRMDFTADWVVLRDAAGSMFLKTAPGVLTCNISTAGPAANGRDQAGAFSANSWVHFWWIGKTDGTIATIVSTSSTAPTLPSGYTHYAYICAARLNASTQLLRIYVAGDRVYYANGLTDTLVLSGGAANTETSISLSTVIPPNAGDFQTNVMVLSSVGTSQSVVLRFISGIDGVKLFASANAWADASPCFPNRSQTIYYICSAAASLSVYVSIIYYSVPNGST